MYKIFIQTNESIEKEVKFASFGKTRTSVKGKKERKSALSEKDILNNQCNKIEKDILELKDKKLGRVANILKLKENISGPKKGVQEPTAVRHPSSGDMVVSNEEIKRVTLEYCVKNLENVLPDPEVEKDTLLKEVLHGIRMKDTSDDGFEIVKDDFETVLDTLQRNIHTVSRVSGRCSR